MENQHLIGNVMHSEPQVEKRELRTSPRIPLDCHLFFSAVNLLEADATLLDLSTTGCAAESATTVQPNMSLDLWIFSPTYSWRMHIDYAIVRWVKGKMFGVEFLNLRPAQRTRLRNLIAKFRV